MEKSGKSIMTKINNKDNRKKIFQHIKKKKNKTKKNITQLENI